MKLIKNSTFLNEVFEIKPIIHKDERGYFFENFNLKRYNEIGIKGPWLQDNVSKSNKGDIRGLHFQNPNPQGKLVSVIYGSVFDVVVDIRKNSPTFCQWFGLELSDLKCNQLWVPPGFAHGFQALTEIAIMNYKCSLNYWLPQDEKSILYNDPDINIEWPIKINKMSQKDTKGKRLKQFQDLPLY